MGSPKAPKPSMEEKAAQSAQTALLNQQREMIQQQYSQQQLLAPLLYKDANIEPYYNVDGSIAGFKDLGPTKEEQAYGKLLDAQTRQLAYSQALQPLEFQQQGYQVTTDAQGNPTGITVVPGGAADLEAQYRQQQLATGKQQQTVNQLLLDRTQQAIRGELPVDPNLESQFGRTEAVLRESLRKNLGPGYDTSTPGIQALADFNRRKQETIYQAQHGEIGSAGAQAIAGQQGGIAPTFSNPYANISNAGTAGQFLSPFTSAGSPNARSAQLLGTVGAPFSNSGGFGTLSQLYGEQAAGLMKSNQGYGALSAQAQQEKQKQYSQYGALAGAAVGTFFGPGYGTAIGGALGGAAGGALA